MGVCTRGKSYTLRVTQLREQGQKVICPSWLLCVCMCIIISSQLGAAQLVSFPIISQGDKLTVDTQTPPPHPIHTHTNTQLSRWIPQLKKGHCHHSEEDRGQISLKEAALGMQPRLSLLQPVIQSLKAETGELNSTLSSIQCHRLSQPRPLILPVL